MSDGIVTSNQGGDMSKIYQETNLRAYSACSICPNCGKTGFTKAEQKWNILNFVFCCCLGPCWACHQLYKKKDLNCYDAQHNCAGCNHPLASYSAC